MKAAIVTEVGQVEVRDVEEVPPAEREILAEIAEVGLCGSDLHVYRGAWKGQGVVHGHGFCGRIVALGDGVEEWQVGDRVTAECFGYCRQCDYCRAGQHNHCREIQWGHGVDTVPWLNVPPSSPPVCTESMNWIMT